MLCEISCINDDNTMGIIQLQLYAFICCQAAVADQLIDLGTNVTLNCDLDENEVYWILQKTPDPPTVILRSFLTPPSSVYLNTTFRNKYSVQFKHRLAINNITADELGVYYCMKTGTPPKLSNSTRIYITESEITQCHNQVEVECIKPNNTVENFTEQIQTQWKIIVLASALMNGLLIIVVIAFAVGKTDRMEKHIYNADLQTQVMYQP